MGGILILVPIVVTSWPAIAAAVTGAAAVMGLSMGNEAHRAAKAAEPAKDVVNKVELDMEDSEVLASGVGHEEEINLTKDGVAIRVFRDESGQLRFCVSGKNRSKHELETFGKQVMDTVTQNYIYNRVVTELKQRNIQVMREEVDEDKTVHIHVRNVLE